jgi:hypothetical protein
MPRKHIAIVALSLAFAAVVGTIALAKTVHLGSASAKPVPHALIVKRTHQLDRFEASLMAQLKRTPPPVPKVAPVPASSAASASPAAAVSASAPPSTQRVVYVRPAPIVIHKHRAGGGYESDSSDHGDGGGGGND